MYRRYAAECTHAAENALSSGLREAYLNLAKGWLRIAAQWEEHHLDEPPQQAIGE